MKANPYPKTIIDEASGIVVSNDKYYLWEEGFKAGIKEVVDAVWNESIGDPRVVGFIDYLISLIKEGRGEIK